MDIKKVKGFERKEPLNLGQLFWKYKKEVAFITFCVLAFCFVWGLASALVFVLAVGGNTISTLGCIGLGFVITILVIGLAIAAQ